MSGGDDVALCRRVRRPASRVDVAGGELHQPQPVDDVGGGEALLDRLAGVGELAAAQRRERAQHVDEAVELEPAAGPLVQPPLQPVAEQRAERLAAAHPVEQRQRVAHARCSTGRCRAPRCWGRRDGG